MRTPTLLLAAALLFSGDQAIPATPNPKQGSIAASPADPANNGLVKQVTFEEAKRAALQDTPTDRTIVQMYLDHILANREQYGKGVFGWDAFGELIYDPNGEKLDAAWRARNLIPKDSSQKYVHRSTGLVFATTPSFNDRQPAKVYIEKLIKKAQNEDQVLSTLDNEAYHADFFYNREVHLQPRIIPTNPKVISLFHELLSFDLQYRQILNGKRDVGPQFTQAMSVGARRLFKELESIAEEESEQAREARAIYNMLLPQPTFQFFVAKADRASKRPYPL
jgi:hypothetical protein